MELTSLEPLPILVFTNLLMITFLVLLSRKGLREPFTFRPWRRYLAILVSFVFCLFSFWGTDWFHYAGMYINLVYMDGLNTSLEYVYYLIANYLSPNYLVFRAIIWGGALYMFCLLCKHVRVRGDLMLSVFCALWLIDFGYGRIVLAYTMMYLGAAVLMKPIRGKVLLSLMLGIALLVSSLFFHKSAFFGIALILLALLPRLLNNRTFALVMIMYPFILLLVQLLLIQFMDTAVDPSEHNSSSAAGQTYLNDDARELGPAYLLYLMLRYVPYYMIAWIAYKVNLLQPGENAEKECDVPSSLPDEVPAEVRFFSRLTVYIVLASTIFLFDLGASTITLYMRFLMYGFIPACVVLAWAWQHRICPRMAKLAFLTGVSGTFYALLYSFYLAYLGVAE